MTTRPTINNCYRTLLKFTNGSGTFLGETHIDARIPTFPFDDTSCADLVDLYGQALLDNDVDGALGASINIPIWTVQNYDDPTRADIDVPSDFAGGEAGQLLPLNVAALVSLRSPLSGRSHRGRSYWFGYTEASSNGIVFDPTSQGNLAAAYAQIVDDLDSFTWPGELVVMSMKLATATAVSSIIVEPDWATVRKRESRQRVA